jgi:hypothetical protein
MEKIMMGFINCNALNALDGIITVIKETIICTIKLKDNIIPISVKNSLLKFAEVNKLKQVETFDEIQSLLTDTDNEAMILFNKI